MARIDAGTVLAGRYRLVESIGQGGMGTVFRGRDDRLGRDIAVKLVRGRGRRGRSDDDMQARFLREAKVMAGLHHPNIVTIHDQGRHRDTTFMVMELLAGPDLGAVQRRDGPLPVEDVLHYGGQVAAALEHLHGHDTPVLHRDLKPNNLFLDRDGVLKVGDFGIAVAPSADMTRYTRIGTLLGTPAYMSPEQCRGEEAEPPSDVYSFGTVLYSLLTSGPPFGGDPVSCIAGITTQPPPPLPDRRPDVPADLAELIHAMLAKHGEARPDAATVRRELRRIAASGVHPTGPAAGTRNGTGTGIGPVDPGGLETIERPRPGSPAKGTDDPRIEALTAELDRVRADLAAGKGRKAATRLVRLLDRARSELGPDHELTRTIAEFGEAGR
jgi:serine/threonine protein kinase